MFFNYPDNCGLIRQNSTMTKTDQYFPKYPRNNRNRLKGINTLKDKFLMERKLLFLISQGRNENSQCN